jgi:hypothetical protein
MRETLRYQPVMHPDGTVAVHETLIDSEGIIRQASYEPVRLEALSVGDLESLIRNAYRDVRKVKIITDDDLDAMIYGLDSQTIEDEDDNVIDLVEYFSRGS